MQKGKSLYTWCLSMIRRMSLYTDNKKNAINALERMLNERASEAEIILMLGKEYGYSRQFYDEYKELILQSAKRKKQHGKSQ